MIKAFNETTELFKNKPKETYDLYILSVLSHAIGNEKIYRLTDNKPSLRLNFYPYSEMHVKSMSNLINQVLLLKDDTSKKVKKIYPKNIAMLFAFSLMKRNASALDTMVGETLKKLNTCFYFLLKKMTKM